MRTLSIGLLVLLVAGLGWAISNGAQEDAVEVVLEQGRNDYTGTRDTTIYQEGDKSNGGGQFIFAGLTNQFNARRALIAFDLSEIPDGATVVSARLELTVSKTQADASRQRLHRLLADWGEGEQDAAGGEGGGTQAAEGDATWDANRLGESTWDSAGGDFLDTPSAEADVAEAGSTAVWESDPLTADVQGWLDGEFDNFGWILIGDEDTRQTAKRFHASENDQAEAGEHPRLIVRYQPASSE